MKEIPPYGEKIQENIMQLTTQAINGFRSQHPRVALWQDIVAFELWQISSDPAETEFAAIHVALLLSQGHGAPIE